MALILRRPWDGQPTDAEGATSESIADRLAFLLTPTIGVDAVSGRRITAPTARAVTQLGIGNSGVQTLSAAPLNGGDCSGLVIAAPISESNRRDLWRQAAPGGAYKQICIAANANTSGGASAGQLVVWVYNSGFVSYATYVGVIDGNLHTYAFRKANGATNFEMFVDGVLRTPSATLAAAFPFDATQVVEFGATNSPAVLAAGWNRLLSNAEFLALTGPGAFQLFEPQRIPIPVAAAGGGGATGTVAVTTGDDTSAANGTVTVEGSLAVTTGADTSAAVGASTVIGSLAVTTAGDTLAASGATGAGASGTVSVTTASDTAAASGTTTVTGALAKTTGSDTAAASGIVGTVTGSLAVTTGNDTCAATNIVVTVKLPNWYYKPGPIPFNAETWITRELTSISRATYGAAPFVQFVDVSVEPSAPRVGLVVYTSAANWNPGSGAGFYGYSGGAWQFLG